MQVKSNRLNENYQKKLFTTLIYKYFTEVILNSDSIQNFKGVHFLKFFKISEIYQVCILYIEERF